MEPVDDEEGDTSSESLNQSSAASPAPAADWAQAARRGQRLSDVTAKGASQAPQAKQAQAGSANTSAHVVLTSFPKLTWTPIMRCTDGLVGRFLAKCQCTNREVGADFTARSGSLKQCKSGTRQGRKPLFPGNAYSTRDLHVTNVESTPKGSLSGCR